MYLKLLSPFLFLIFFVGCATKQPKISQSATIIFKTPTMKFYDKGFVEKYEDMVNLNIFTLGVSVFKIDIYKDRVCYDTILCLDNKSFNEKFLVKSYDDEFLYNLLRGENINFKDKENGVFIKVIYDEFEDNKTE